MSKEETIESLMKEEDENFINLKNGVEELKSCNNKEAISTGIALLEKYKNGLEKYIFDESDRKQINKLQVMIDDLKKLI